VGRLNLLNFYRAQATLDKFRAHDDRRAAGQFAELNARYFQFVDQLPLPLRNVARLKSTFSGRPGDELFSNLGERNPSLIQTPWLFWEIFNHLDDGGFLQVVEGGVLIVLASIILDHLSDGQARSPQAMFLLHQMLHETGVLKLREAVPIASPFWSSHFDRLSKEHLGGLAAELEAQSNPGLFSPDAFVTMAHGKLAPVVTYMAALTEASDQKQALEPIEASLKHWAVGAQLVDDIEDWQIDVQARHLTYYLTRIAPPETWEAAEWPSVNDLQSRIDADWLDVTYMRMAMQWLDKAIEAVDGLQCPRWVGYVDSRRSLADGFLTKFITRHILWVLDPSVHSS
jgi:hypothetical protein